MQPKITLAEDFTVDVVAAPTKSEERQTDCCRVSYGSFREPTRRPMFDDLFRPKQAPSIFNGVVVVTVCTCTR